MENQNIRVSIPWEHSLTNLLGHDSTSDPGIALRQWVHFQGVENILDLLSWEEEELKAIPVQQVFTLDDHGQGSYLRTNQTKQICGLITYMKHVFREYNSGIEVRRDPFHPFLPEEWNQHTSTMLRTFLIQHLPNPIGPEPVISGPISSSRPTGYSPAAMEEFISLSSSTPEPTMGYDHYLTLLQNACIRYDNTHTSKPSPASRAAYQHGLS